MTQYSDYLYKAAGTTQITDLIHGTGINHSTMSRYLSGERRMPISVVVAMSEKYHLPLLDGMLAAQFITPEHADRERARYGLTMSDQDLAAEFLRRLEGAHHDQLKQFAAQPVGTPLEASNVSDLSVRRRRVTAEDVTEDDLQSQAAYRPEADETPDRDSY